MNLSFYRYAPVWIIFTLDLICCLLAMILAFALQSGFHIEELVRLPWLKISGVTLIINATVFFIFRTYKGVVRFMAIEDINRIFLANVIVFLLLVIVELIQNTGNALVSIFPMTTLLVYFMAVNVLMLCYRFIVRRLFQYYFLSRKKGVKTVLYNAGNEGRLIFKMISEHSASDLKIMAFLDDGKKLKGKAIQGIPILRAKEDTFKQLKADGIELLLIASRQVSKTRLNELVDLCIQYDIRIQQVPSSHKWLNNKMETRVLKDIKIEQLLDRSPIQILNKKITQQLKGKTILVTGAAGSIGSEIVEQLLLHDPALVLALDVAETPLHALQLRQGDSRQVTALMGDVCDPVLMRQLFDTYHPHFVYHAAAFKHVPLMENHPSLAVLNNVEGTRLLAKLSHEHGVEKFVMVSTDKAVNPTNVMGASKRIAEIFIQSYAKSLKGSSHTRFITTRFGNVLGSNGSVIPRFKQQIKEGGPVTVTHPDITRYFMTISEACQLVLEAGSMGNGGEIFIFDMGEPVKIADLARKMIRLSGKIPDKDVQVVFNGLRPGEKLYEELLNDAESVLPTYHEKIKIAKVREYDFEKINLQLSDLVKSAQQHQRQQTVQLMKVIVPEFVSQNSDFQQLDATVKAREVSQVQEVKGP